METNTIATLKDNKGEKIIQDIRFDHVSSEVKNRITVYKRVGTTNWGGEKSKTGTVAKRTTQRKRSYSFSYI